MVHYKSLKFIKEITDALKLLSVWLFTKTKQRSWLGRKKGC